MQPLPLRAPATAKLNLALVVGERRPDGLHEVATVMQRLALADRISLAPADGLSVTGFESDTLVRAALEALARRAGVAPAWRAHVWKRIPVAAGLGGGSSDAATALRLANRLLDSPLGGPELHELAASLGADVPFFLTAGPQLAEGSGTELAPLCLPVDYWVVLLLPRGEAKRSTAAVYRDWEASGGGRGFAGRRARLLEALERVVSARDLAGLPGNDLAGSPFCARLLELGAFRASVSGAGPTVYGLFSERDAADAAYRAVEPLGRAWLTMPAWYG